MKQVELKLLMALACLCPASALAQSTTDPFFADCPSLSVQQQTRLHWEPIRAPGMLFCRAVREDGTDAFALTFSRESPFNPRSSDRAEVGSFKGQGVQWYESRIAADRSALVREALIDFGEGHILHISLQAHDPETLANQQREVLALPISQSRQLAGGN